ncbi:unnamed protein product [Hermetia illucens]|uniref:Inositol polyphosphate 1-phosphatase n=1 Tax=Hermetia illucens TaxID=343691 RepID=A0A7R8UPY9_HERIL|nr:inositol polyphosphate 1-phosphatase [Hermetia illucens]XP_037909676.1 inositol polyphosphate 1-phosphatase [Hermetia illucens]CAD7084508.1 unnamed protein product [Hermetia illucens]
MSRDFLKTLMNCSEKAANIARKCRADEHLLALLVEEKSADEANPRFIKDFKTLADVLIQETIRYEVGKLFPEMVGNINGEESATFTNTLGESVTIAIGENAQETAACLEKVLNQNKLAAELLAEEVHREVEYIGSGPTMPMAPSDLNYNKIGIWIDPIDATAEYIAGETVFTNFPGITSTGLDCVTILLGVFSIQNGYPLAGIINQPFGEKIGENKYASKVYWGVSLGSFSANNIPPPAPLPKKIAVLSGSENPEVVERIKSLGYEIAVTAGAGHKALKVILGEANLYLLSKSSTFKWDTCAPQAILQSLGAGIFDFKKSIKTERLQPIMYDQKAIRCNLGGLVAVRDLKLGMEVLKVLAAD